MTIRKLANIVILLLALVSITACDSLSLNMEKAEEQLTLKVLYAHSSSFKQTWGGRIAEAMPHISFQVIETNEASSRGRDLATLITEEQPDLIYMGNTARYNELAELGLLAPLDSRIHSEQSFLNELYQPAIQHLVVQQPQLFGLPVQFDTKLLFFNKTLFDVMQAPYPHEGISWHEVMALAEGFAGQQHNAHPIYGFEDYDWDESPYNPFLIAEQIGLSRGMYFFDEHGQVNIHTDEWAELFAQVADAYTNQSFYMPENDDLLYNGEKIVNHYVKDKPFLAGRTAMALHSVSLFGFLYDLENYEGLDTDGLDYGVVPAPIDPGGAGTTMHVNPVHIFGMYTDSPHKDEAWSVIAFLTGDAFAQQATDLVRFDSKYGERLPIRPQYIKMDGVEMTEFTRQVLDVTGVSLYRSIKPDLLQHFRKTAGEQLREVISGRSTVDEALSYLQNRL